VSLVFDAASELRRTQLEDTRFVVESIPNNLLEDEALDVRERNVTNGHLENHPVLVGSDKGFFQESSVGSCFEAEQVLGNAAFEEFHVRVLKLCRAEEGLALLDGIKNLLKRRYMWIAAVAVAVVIIVVAIVAATIYRCRSVASRLQWYFVLCLRRMEAIARKLVEASTIATCQRSGGALPDIANHCSSHCG
jgi:hypothetical protein